MAGAMHDGALRFRQKSSNGVQNNRWNGIVEDGEYRVGGAERRRHLLSGVFYFYVLLLYVFVACAVYYAQNALPDAISEAPKDERAGHTFVGKRARETLIELVSIGPRSVGSYENEVAAVDVILRRLKSIQNGAQLAHAIEIDVQTSNGSFYVDFIDGFTSSYRAIKNVVARISPRGNSNAMPSLLVNCHYDSAPSSPGATDDAINCAIMMEVLQVLSQRRVGLPHPVVFLFNGAEENILQGSHGFITQHKWAKDVKAFVNLEACGGGGKEILFQASPNHPWLVRSYMEGAVRPFASIIAEEVFQSGIILSDTDFRIFRDFGGLPGLDFAYATNGHVYHTKYDSLEYVPDGSVQHGGDNILGLVLKILEAPEFPKGAPRSRGEPQTVYFDFLCLFMVTYFYTTGNLVAKLAAVVSLLSLAWRIKKLATDGGKRSLLRSVWARAEALALILASTVAGVIASVGVSLLLTLLGSTMSWYAKPYLFVGLYYCGCVGAILAVQWWVALRRRRKRETSFRGWEEEEWSALEHFLDATQLLWIAALVVLMAAGIKGIYIPIAWEAIAGTVLSAGSPWLLRLGRRGQQGRMFLVVAAASVVPLVLSVYLSMSITRAVLPIVGRIGTSTNPEIIVAVFSSCLAIQCTSYLVPFVHVSEKGSRLVYALLGACALSVLVAVSPLGFPYSAAPGSASPQRILFFNVQRTFHDRRQEEVGRDGGIWAVPLDYNGPRSLRLVTKGRRMERVDCDRLIYCGMPYYFPVISKLRETYYIEAPGPIFPKERKFRLVSRTRTALGTTRLAFRFAGPTHMGITLSPRKDVSLVGWSLTRGPIREGYQWKGRPTYFVYLSQGKDLGDWDVWIDLKVPEGHDESEPIVDLAYYTHYMQRNDQSQPAFRRFLSELPEWIHPTPWASSADFYTF